jgi:Ca2+-binding EF-hand superfamily protein
MDKADGDKNGSVTREEFSKNLPRWFDRADKDKDGKVTKAELDQFLERREKRAEMSATKPKADQN